MILIAAEAFALLAALAGLFLGLKMPNLHWTNEIVPIKQGVNVMLSLLGGWVYAAAMCALYFLFGWQLGAVGYLMLFTLITLAFSAGLYVWLRKKGAVPSLPHYKRKFCCLWILMIVLLFCTACASRCEQEATKTTSHFPATRSMGREVRNWF